MYGIFSSARKPLVHFGMRYSLRSLGSSGSFNEFRRFSSDKDSDQDQDTILSNIANKLDDTGTRINSGFQDAGSVLQDAGSKLGEVYKTMGESFRELNPAFGEIRKDIKSQARDIEKQRIEVEKTNIVQRGELEKFEQKFTILTNNFEQRKNDFKNFTYGFGAFWLFSAAGTAVGAYWAKDQLSKAKKESGDLQARVDVLQTQISEITHEDRLNKIADLEKRMPNLISTAESVERTNEKARGLGFQDIKKELTEGHSEMQQKISVMVEEAKKDIVRERDRALESVQKIQPLAFKDRLLVEIEKETLRVQARWNESFSSYRIFGYLSRGSSHQGKLRALEALRSEIANSKTPEFKCSAETKKLLNEAYDYRPEEEDKRFKRDFIEVYLKDNTVGSQSAPRM